jgi:futalosine hydrolase
MPHVLIVSATTFEVQPLLEKYAMIATGDGLIETYINEKDKLSVLITGVGMVNTAFAMGRYLNNIHRVVINVGICGAFTKSIKIGEVVHICSDELIEMGAEDGDDFILFDDLNLSSTNKFKNNWHIQSKTIDDLQKVKGVTVNKVHGNELSIEKAKKLFDPDIESMEGAAFFAGCKRLDNYTQIRAISNYVEKRDKSKWNISLAIENLNITLQKTLQEIYRAH